MRALAIVTYVFTLVGLAMLAGAAFSYRDLSGRCFVNVDWASAAGQ
jgi:hypothetical protein